MSAYHDHRLHVNITQAMNEHLDHLASLRKITKAELVRQGLRYYLDEQADVTTSRKHFTKSFQRRLDHVDWQQSVLLHLLLMVIHLVLKQNAPGTEPDMDRVLEIALNNSMQDDLQTVLHNARLHKPKPPTD
ncbi:MAG: hypothetical protein L0154_12330 [Chloroflexi bacterium]|nr:hypothetical protein [Chloroflexota bacterium]